MKYTTYIKNGFLKYIDNLSNLIVVSFATKPHLLNLIKKTIFGMWRCTKTNIYTKNAV